MFWEYLGSEIHFVTMHSKFDWNHISLLHWATLPENLSATQDCKIDKQLFWLAVSGEKTCFPPMPSSTPYIVGWVCCLISSLFREVFSKVFSCPLSKTKKKIWFNNNYEIMLWSTVYLSLICSLLDFWHSNCIWDSMNIIYFIVIGSSNVMFQ